MALWRIATTKEPIATVETTSRQGRTQLSKSLSRTPSSATIRSNFLSCSRTHNKLFDLWVKRVSRWPPIKELQKVLRTIVRHLDSSNTGRRHWLLSTKPTTYWCEAVPRTPFHCMHPSECICYCMCSFGDMLIIVQVSLLETIALHTTWPLIRGFWCHIQLAYLQIMLNQRMVTMHLVPGFWRWMDLILRLWWMGLVVCV